MTFENIVNDKEKLSENEEFSSAYNVYNFEKVSIVRMLHILPLVLKYYFRQQTIGTVPLSFDSPQSYVRIIRPVRGKPRNYWGDIIVILSHI